MFEESDVIFRYTRRQAIEDGVLIDVSEVSGSVGFKYPVALTAGAWAEAVESDEAALRYGHTPAGRLFDVLFALRVAIARVRHSRTDTVRFSVEVAGPGSSRSVELKAICGPGDDEKPVLTIMLPGED